MVLFEMTQDFLVEKSSLELFNKNGNPNPRFSWIRDAGWMTGSKFGSKLGLFGTVFGWAESIEQCTNGPLVV